MVALTLRPCHDDDDLYTKFTCTLPAGGTEAIPPAACKQEAIPLAASICTHMPHLCTDHDHDVSPIRAHTYIQHQPLLPLPNPLFE